MVISVGLLDISVALAGAVARMNWCLMDQRPSKLAM